MNGIPAAVRSSLRRGEEDARIKRMSVPARSYLCALNGIARGVMIKCLAPARERACGTAHGTFVHG